MALPPSLNLSVLHCSAVFDGRKQFAERSGHFKFCPFRTLAKTFVCWHRLQLVDILPELDAEDAFFNLKVQEFKSTKGDHKSFFCPHFHFVSLLEQGTWPFYSLLYKDILRMTALRCGGDLVVSKDASWMRGPGFDSYNRWSISENLLF